MISSPEQDTPGEVTRLLRRWHAGDQVALEQLSKLVYPELLQMARSYLRKEVSPGAVTPTELVHEAYLKLLQGGKPAWENRAHFYGVAARLMRQVLVDHSRRRRAMKRDGEMQPLGNASGTGSDDQLMAMDRALEDLARFDPRKVQIVELRLFAGLSADEVAAALKLSPVTVRRDLRLAMAWLKQRTST
jgi:RNA polymerase sigma factor (TIGR02999 family)